MAQIKIRSQNLEQRILEGSNEGQAGMSVEEQLTARRQFERNERNHNLKTSLYRVYLGVVPLQACAAACGINRMARAVGNRLSMAQPGVA